MLARRGRLLHGGILRASTLVTGGSSYVLDLARRAGANGAALRLAPLPVDTRAFELVPARDASASGPPTLLHVAAYLPVKGQDLSIRTLSRVREQAPEARLTMIGENPHGYLERMSDLARQLELQDAVDFIERLPHAELGRHYVTADLLLMPSRHESQGMVVLEAGWCGLPAVGSAVGVVADLAPRSAVAVPVDDPVALADAVIELLADEARRRMLGDSARRAVQERYAVAPAIQRWLGIYAEARERN
jgi:glycosyltransferase involved in cell wall biosynthesis